MFNLSNHDEMLAQGQIQLIDSVVAFLARLRARIVATVSKLDAVIQADLRLGM